MLSLFFEFYSKLWRFYLLSHIYREEFITNSDCHSKHHHYRRYTKEYEKKKDIVRQLWVVAGLLTLMFPILPFMAVILISTTFLSFVFLDETE